MFLGKSLIAMADGSTKPVSSLLKGDLVQCCKPYVPGYYVDKGFTYVEREVVLKAEMVAEVACLLVYPYMSSCVRVQDTSLIIRDRHPIKHPGSGAWVPAYKLRAPESYFRSPEEEEAAYHVLLAEGAPSNTVVLEGLIVASIGAWINEGVHYHLHSHSWFADYSEVADEMREVDPDGWKSGRVEVSGIKRSGDDDGCTCGLKKE